MQPIQGGAPKPLSQKKQLELARESTKNLIFRINTLATALSSGEYIKNIEQIKTLPEDWKKSVADCVQGEKKNEEEAARLIYEEFLRTIDQAKIQKTANQALLNTRKPNRSLQENQAKLETILNLHEKLRTEVTKLEEPNVGPLTRYIGLPVAAAMVYPLATEIGSAITFGITSGTGVEGTVAALRYISLPAALLAGIAVPFLALLPKISSETTKVLGRIRSFVPGSKKREEAWTRKKYVQMHERGLSKKELLSRGQKTEKASKEKAVKEQREGSSKGKEPMEVEEEPSGGE